MTYLPKLTKRMNDTMNRTTQETSRRVPMPEKRSHKRFSKQAMMLSWLVLLVLGVFLVVPQQSEAGSQTDTVDGTWTCPVGVTSVTVEVWGAGGGGGSTTSNNSSGGGGGGG
jgi:hypothetical protein